jgi:hypothetical protein
MKSLRPDDRERQWRAAQTATVTVTVPRPNLAGYRARQAVRDAAGANTRALPTVRANQRFEQIKTDRR